MNVVATCVYSVFALLSMIGIKIAKKKESKNKSDLKTIDLNEISVIIPFRNESKRISPLLESIKNSKLLPKHFYFVDDHSTDSSVELISMYINKGKMSIVTLPKNNEGKKSAIAYTIGNYVKTKFVLTIDADTYFTSDYFKQLETLAISELTILPVQMNGQKIMTSCFAYDYSVLNTVNRIAYGYSTPILASGANLLFSVEKYLLHNGFEEHKNYLSGDDQFLLNNFISNNIKPTFSSHYALTIKTQSPETIKTFIQQRVRWFQKNNVSSTRYSNLILSLNASVQLVFYVSIIMGGITKEWTEITLLFLFKVIVDHFVINVLNKQKHHFFTVLLTSIIQPFYYLSLLILVLTYIPQWKGRETILNQ